MALTQKLANPKDDKGGSVTSTTTVEGSTNVMFESSSRKVKRSKAAAVTREPLVPSEELVQREADEVRHPKDRQHNTSYREFVWEGGGDDDGADLTWVQSGGAQEWEKLSTRLSSQDGSFLLFCDIKLHWHTHMGVAERSQFECTAHPC